MMPQVPLVSMISSVIMMAIIFSTSMCELINNDLYHKLKEIQMNINTNEQSFCYNSHSGTRGAFLSKIYQKYTGDLNILVYPFCLMTHELGNRLGNYFHEVACAEASGLHFITVHHQWDISGSFHGHAINSTSNVNKKLFLNSLPDVIVHANPSNRFHAEKRIERVCKCTRYCWQDAKAPWVNRTDSIGKYLHKAFDKYMSSFPSNATTTVDLSVDFTNAKPNQYLPLIPDTAIQYRCGDNIGFSYMYGIMPFTAFVHRIPPTSNFIYVLSDHPSRAVHSPYTSRCHVILQQLFIYLKKHFDHSTIVIKRGGDIFLDYARLGTANTTICSVSSFCFWPAVSNPGTSYFPLTNLIAGAHTNTTAPNFGSKFRWIDEPIISNMKKFRPWTQIIDVLTGKSPMPE